MGKEQEKGWTRQKVAWNVHCGEVSVAKAVGEGVQRTRAVRLQGLVIKVYGPGQALGTLT